MEGRGRRWEWAWNSEKETEKREGLGVSFQSDACQALTKVLVFWGDVTWIGGWTSSEEHSSPAGIISRKFA